MQGQCLPIEMANRLEKVQQVRKNLLNAAAGSLSKLPLLSHRYFHDYQCPCCSTAYHHSYHTTTLMLLSITIFLMLLTTSAVGRVCFLRISILPYPYAIAITVLTCVVCHSGAGWPARLRERSVGSEEHWEAGSRSTALEHDHDLLQPLILSKWGEKCTF